MRKVGLSDNIRRIVKFDPKATNGAIVGVNLWLEDGTLVTYEMLFAAEPPDEEFPFTYWKLIREVPPNVRALAATDGVGLFAVTGDAEGAMRAIEVVDGELTVEHGNGVDGNPTLGLADVGDAGGGTLQKTEFDAKGRKTGTSGASTDDLAEGDVNLYFTDERAQDAVGDVADDTGDVELHYEASPARRLWATLSAAVLTALGLATTAVQEVVAGANVTVDNSDPQRPIVSSTGTGSGGVATVQPGTGIDVDATDPENPIVALDSASQASLALADSALQPGDSIAASDVTGLAAVATSGSYGDLSDLPALGSAAASDVSDFDPAGAAAAAEAAADAYTDGQLAGYTPTSGLGSAAFAATTDFDAAGAAAGAETAAGAYTDAQVGGLVSTLGTAAYAATSDFDAAGSAAAAEAAADAYTDGQLANYTPTAGLGSAAFTASTDYATAAQGATADTALQPGAIIPATDVSGFDAAAQSAVVRQSITAGELGTAPSEDAVNAALALKIDLAEKGVALGIAPLAGDGKIDVAYLPASVIGQVQYKGTWAANSGSPPTSTPEMGWYYIVDTAGSTDLDGITDWLVGDWAIYNGATWDKVDNTDAISSWNGRTGAVMPLAGDYTPSDVGAEPAFAAGTTAEYQRGDKTWRNFATDVRAAVLVGLSTASSAAITIADTVLSAFGKLQAQITALTAVVASNDAAVVHISGAENVTGAKNFAGALSSTHTNGVGLTVERTGAAVNSSIEFKTTGGSIYAGQQSSGSWRINSTANLASFPWFEATATAVLVAGQTVWHNGNLPASAYFLTLVDDANAQAARVTLNAATNALSIVGKNTAYTFVNADDSNVTGKTTSTAQTYTIDASVLKVGVFYFAANFFTSGNVTLTPFAGTTMRLTGTTTTGNRTIAPNGMARIFVRSAAELWVDGPGVT